MFEFFNTDSSQCIMDAPPIFHSLILSFRTVALSQMLFSIHSIILALAL
ncbi:MAG: hypothetical protein WCG25_01275 [bacterium]